MQGFEPGWSTDRSHERSWLCYIVVLGCCGFIAQQDYAESGCVLIIILSISTEPWHNLCLSAPGNVNQHRPALCDFDSPGRPPLWTDHHLDVELTDNTFLSTASMPRRKKRCINHILVLEAQIHRNTRVSPDRLDGEPSDHAKIAVESCAPVFEKKS